MGSTIVTTKSGSVYYIDEIHKMFSGGKIKDSTSYQFVAGLVVGAQLLIVVGAQTIRTSEVVGVQRGRTVLD